MHRKRTIFYGLAFGMILSPATGATGELAKIQSQIKQTEQQNKQIEQKLKTSTRDVEQTKKQLVKTADRVSSLE